MRHGVIAAKHEVSLRTVRREAARLTDALRLIDDAMLVSRLNALGHPAETPPRLALTHRGHESAPIALESHVPDLSASLEKP